MGLHSLRRCRKCLSSLYLIYILVCRVPIARALGLVFVVNRVHESGIMASKEDDDDDFPVDRAVLDDFAESFFDESVEEEFHQFVKEEAPKFRNASKEQAHDEEEHSLEHYNSYLKFVEMAERRLDEFLDKHNISKEDFVNMCEMLQNDESGDFDDHKFIVNVLLATTDYHEFLNLMREEIREQDGFDSESD
eukprot:gb/GECG01015000.1/.p1 GENE.gb/GECG01015000.1/~~gb/GECG01015000.1/.p1  ORF type:complete len:192 (+),score=36.23 gb/GECG01015000.1/:1-576(+)